MGNIILAALAIAFTAFLLGALVGYGIATEEHSRHVQALTELIRGKE